MTGRTAWDQYPREERYLFNPAFLALLLARSSKGYERERLLPMSIPLAFLSLSITLHRPTRELLPRTVATNLVRWAQENPYVVTVTPTRAGAFVPLFRESLLFAVANKVCSITPGAGLRPAPDFWLPAPRGRTDDMVQCQRSAIFLGRWLARAGPPPTVLALFGVRP